MGSRRRLRGDAPRLARLRRRVGGDIRVRLAKAELTGQFSDLDASGRLLLTLPDGSVTMVAAGDVFPLKSDRDANSGA